MGPFVESYGATVQVTERMRRMSEHRWAFEPPAEAPMKADCAACGKAVVLLRPRVADVAAGQYVVEGACQDCGAAVRLSIP